MRATPGPYAAWASWLAAFGRGEDLPITHLVPIGDEMGPDMQARLLRRLNEAFVARQDMWHGAFNRDQDTMGMTPLSLGTNMIQARVRLRPLVDLVRNDLLPAPVRAALADALAKAVRSTQRSLLDSVRRLPHGADVLHATVMDNDLTAALTAPSRVDGPGDRPVGRTIIM